jgi:chromosome segregation ATPase
MFFDILWIAFIVELLVGIIIGWLFASFFPWRKNSFGNIWGSESTQGFPSTQSTGSAINNMENKLQKVDADLVESREALTRSETDLFQLKTENDTLKDKLTKEQTWRESLEAQVGYYKNEVVKTLTLAKTLESQVTRYKNEAAQAQASAKVGASRADINKT